MDIATDVRDFLASRRARITPAQAGLPAYSTSRRVPGLKREEVAVLAGVSTEYYARLERGNLRGVSESVLASVARALQLDEAERAHLFDLARAAGSSQAKDAGRRPRPRVRPSIAQILDGMTGIPAYIRTSRMDVVAANRLCQVLYAGVLDDSALPLNLARFVFLDARARELYAGWDAMADDFAASLRVEAGRHPKDPALNALVGELATGSPEFATRWARHSVKVHSAARKVLRHPLVGEIELIGDALELPGDDLTLIVYTAEPDSPATEQLAFLASWHQARQHGAGDYAADEVHDEEPESPPRT
jgi:transcriptional regulator with XRE-family HTH domain